MAKEEVNEPGFQTFSPDFPESMLIRDKKALLNWRTNLDLHTLLVMKSHGYSKGQALVQVYAEGVEGLSKRLTR